MIKNGANPHFEDFDGVTCQEKAILLSNYENIKGLTVDPYVHFDTRVDSRKILEEQT